jgi:hypothetical protein
MNRSKLRLFATLACTLTVAAFGAPPGAPGAALTVLTNAPATNEMPGARILFQNPIYDFGRINAGEPVKATFVFTNVGDETLVISAVQPSCGCTTAGEWTRQAEPGHGGTIPVQFTSTGFGGPVSKLVTVVSNDKQHPTTTLQIKGTIWKAIDVIPQYAVLNVLPDTPGATSVLNITNNTEQPLTLSAPEVNNPAFTVELRTNEAGRSFQLAVSTSANKVGTAQGQVTMRTSSTNMPVLTVTIWANVQPAINVIPPSVNLPPAPLTTQLTPIVTLINNTTNPVTFSDAAVNIPGVQLQPREIQVGKYFTATLVFPVGFEIPTGQTAELSVKSSHPKYPLIKVPIIQPPRPAALGQQPAPAIHPPAAVSAASASARQPHVVPRPATAAVQPPMPPMPPTQNKTAGGAVPN